MQNKNSKKVFMFLVLMTISTTFLAYSQTYKSKSSSRAAQIINKLNQDVKLTEKQKAVITAKLDSLALNSQNNGEKSVQNDIAFSKGIRKIRQEIQDSILTPSQLSELKAKQESRKKIIVEQYKQK